MRAPCTRRAAVAKALLAYADELSGAHVVQVGGAFTPNTEADRFVKASPAAFVIGVLFTQGIPAERAWAGPYLLAMRLGHFDLRRIATESEDVVAAFAAPPALHRFVKTVPRWVISAAARILRDYGGDASNIWVGGAHVLDVTDRLLAFDGIGEKKAAMAVELLGSSLGVELCGVECGSVAYDVHVRRVFLRAGLVDEDTPDAVRRAAAEASPARPGAIDLPTWLIGRETCRPRVPACEFCRIGAVCPRFVERNAEGVGVRRGRS